MLVYIAPFILRLRRQIHDMEPKTIELDENHHLCVEQIGSSYHCTAFRFSPETKTFIQVRGSDDKMELVVDSINSAASFQKILVWLGEKWAVTLFKKSHQLFGDT